MLRFVADALALGAVRFRLLGPLEACDDRGNVVPVLGVKPQAVLAVLLLHPDGASSQQLALALYPDDSPDDVDKARGNVKRLRDALGESGSRITNVAGVGYRLRRAPGDLDADRFAQLVEEGRAAISEGDPERATVLLRDALALWRGRALQGLESEPFAREQIDRLDALRDHARKLLDGLRTEAEEQRIEAELASGRTAGLIAALEDLVTSHPERERPWEHLMLCLYRSGRQHDALEAYQRARRSLVAVGLEPGRQLRELQERILRQDPALDQASRDRRDPARVEHATAPGDPASSRQMPFMVPPPSGSIVRRARLLDQALDLVCGNETCDIALSSALRGAGGFGKTILAEELGRDQRVHRRFPGGVLWTTLGPRCVGSHLAARLNTLSYELADDRPRLLDPEEAGRHLAALLTDRGTWSTLLVIDDVWRAEQTKAFRALPASCTRLFTTRVATTLRDMPSLLVDEMEHWEGRQMLLAGLGDGDPGRELDALLEYTRGWPLLIALVKGQLTQLLDQGATAEEAMRFVRGMLESRGPQVFDFAAGSEAVTPSIDLSLDFLAETSPEHVACFESLAVFEEERDIPVTLLESFWKMPPADVEALCLRLAGIHLLRITRLAPMRIRLHEVIRSYLWHRLGDDRIAGLSGRLLDLSAHDSASAS